METKTSSTTLVAGEVSREKIPFRIFISFLLSALYSLLSTSPAQAASLFISPNSNNVSVGEAFSINVLISAPTQAINATEATIFFPSSKLRVISVSDSDSILNLWVKKPSFSNSLGTIDFSGVILDPGFIGSAGKVLTVNFRTLAPGSAPIILTNGAILANDGKGTNVLDELRDANYFISAAAPPIATPKKVSEEKTMVPEATPPEGQSIKTPEEPITSDQSSPPAEGISTPDYGESLIYINQPIIQLINLVILLALLVLFWYLWKRLSIATRELEDLETEKYKQLDLLRQDIKKRITTLEEIESQKGLTMEEREIFDELQSELTRTAWQNR